MLLAIFSTLFLITAAKEAKDTLTAVEASNELAFKLYRILAKRNASANVIYSPATIAVALGTASLAAADESKNEIEEFMSWDSITVHSGMKTFLDTLRDNQQRSKVYFANRIYADESLNPSKDYTKKAFEYYGADLGEEDFAGKTSRSRKKLNDWIKKATQKKVKNFLPYRVLSETDEVVLVNAIHFKANWLKGFKGKLTGKNFPFRMNEESKPKNVRMMKQENDFNYTYCDEVKAQVLELPFDGDQYSMFIFLPKENRGPPKRNTLKKKKVPKKKNVPQAISPLESMELKLNLQSFQNCIELAMSKIARVRLFLPEFKLREQIEMKTVFGTLGVESLFKNAQNGMGLNGITKYGGESSRVDKIIHQSFISIGAKGKAGHVGGHHRSKKAPMFKADHPFVFFVRDNKLGSILLVGRVTEPLIKLPPIKARRDD